MMKAKTKLDLPVLWIEDHEDVIKSMTGSFDQNKIKFVSHPSGDFLKDQTIGFDEYGLVIIDIELENNWLGTQVFAMIRDQNPFLPMVFLSAADHYDRWDIDLERLEKRYGEKLIKFKKPLHRPRHKSFLSFIEKVKQLKSDYEECLGLDPFNTDINRKADMSQILEHRFYAQIALDLRQDSIIEAFERQSDFYIAWGQDEGSDISGRLTELDQLDIPAYSVTSNSRSFAFLNFNSPTVQDLMCEESQSAEWLLSFQKDTGDCLYWSLSKSKLIPILRIRKSEELLSGTPFNFINKEKLLTSTWIYHSDLQGQDIPFEGFTYFETTKYSDKYIADGVLNDKTLLKYLGFEQEKLQIDTVDIPRLNERVNLYRQITLRPLVNYESIPYQVAEYLAAKLFDEGSNVGFFKVGGFFFNVTYNQKEYSDEELVFSMHRDNKGISKVELKSVGGGNTEYGEPSILERDIPDPAKARSGDFSDFYELQDMIYLENFKFRHPKNTEIKITKTDREIIPRLLKFSKLKLARLIADKVHPVNKKNEYEGFIKELGLPKIIDLYRCEVIGQGEPEHKNAEVHMENIFPGRNEPEINTFMSKKFLWSQNIGDREKNQLEDVCFEFCVYHPTINDNETVSRLAPIDY